MKYPDTRSSMDKHAKANSQSAQAFAEVVFKACELESIVTVYAKLLYSFQTPTKEEKQMLKRIKRVLK